LKVNNTVYIARDFAIPEKAKRWSLKKTLRKNKDLLKTYEEWKPLISFESEDNADLAQAHKKSDDNTDWAKIDEKIKGYQVSEIDRKIYEL